MDNNHQDADDEVHTPKRAPVLASSTIIGAGLGCVAGFVYMALATNADGSGVKGSEWLLFAIAGCVLGIVVGFFRDILQDESTDPN